jgi:hypothetical protein
MAEERQKVSEMIFSDRRAPNAQAAVVTLGRERPSGSSCDSLAANGGGKYLPTYVQRVLSVS